MDPDKVPSRIEIQEWLETQIPFKCYLTKEPLTKARIELDHKEATSRGGTFGLLNVGVTSRHMNAAKGGMHEKEFRGLLKLISKWEDGGHTLLMRLRASNNVFRRG